MTETLIALVSNGSAIAWLAWEVRQLRSELTADIEDLRHRVRRLETKTLEAARE